MRSRVISMPSLREDEAQPRKQGIWFSERMQAASWQLGPGQQIVAHCHPGADSMIVVVAGSGEYHLYDEAGPADPVRYVSKPDAVVVPPPPGEIGTPAQTVPVGPGSVAMTAAGWFYGLTNTGDEPLIAIAVTAPDFTDGVYTVRTPAAPPR